MTDRIYIKTNTTGLADRHEIVGPHDGGVPYVPETVQADNQTVRDLTMLVLQLMQTAPPERAKRASDYLNRKGLSSPLRALAQEDTNDRA